MAYLESNDILSYYQYVFRQKRFAMVLLAYATYY